MTYNINLARTFVKFFSSLVWAVGEFLFYTHAIFKVCSMLRVCARVFVRYCACNSHPSVQRITCIICNDQGRICMSANTLVRTN